MRDTTEAWEVPSNPSKREKYEKARDEAGGGTKPDWGDDDFGGGAFPPYLDISEEPVAITAILAALAAGQVPDLYARAGCLVALETQTSDITGTETVRVANVDAHRRRALLHGRVPTMKFDKQGVPSQALPTVTTCLTILRRRDWPGMPVLRGVVHAPVLRRPDGGLVQQPGYDPQTGLYLHPALDLKPVPGDPSDSDIAAAKHLLLDVLLADFPWVRDADRANYLAALFTPALRPLTGLSPFYAIDAPERGSGKTLLGVDIPRAVPRCARAALPRRQRRDEKGDPQQPAGRGQHPAGHHVRQRGRDRQG